MRLEEGYSVLPFQLATVGVLRSSGRSQGKAGRIVAEFISFCTAKLAAPDCQTHRNVPPSHHLSKAASKFYDA